MIRVLIVDDHSLIREGVKLVLARCPEITTVLEAENGRDALRIIRGCELDLVLLDISMPGGMDGLDVLKQIKYEFPAIPVLMLTMYPEEQYAIRTLKAGASGYLTKQSVPRELINAVGRVLEGKKYISADLGDFLASNMDADTVRPLHATLSDREFQVMTMIVSGKKNREIADEMQLSPKTVSTYLSRIMDKLRVKSVVELTRYAFDYSLVIK